MVSLWRPGPGTGSTSATHSSSRSAVSNSYLELLSGECDITTDQTKYNWTGLLVEPNSGAYQQLVGRRRRAHCVRSCLAVTPHPDIVTFDSADVFGGINVKLDNVDNQHLENVNM